MRSELLGLAATLAGAGEPFAFAVVVRREPASSAQVGNMAVISERGDFHGWLGGSCIRPTVIREARAALADGTPRLISLSPDQTADTRAGVHVFPMTCHSGGSVDIYIEPVLPAPHLLVFGVTPAAQALVRLGKGMGFQVDAIDPEADTSTFPEADHVFTSAASLGSQAPAEQRSEPASALPNARLRWAVVATHGQRDEEAIAEALALEPDYVGLVASSRRFAQIRQTLVARGVPAEAIDRVKSPAGLDIGATTAEEVALSILAEVVQVRHRGHEPARPSASRAPTESIDPVCGMTVEIATAKHLAVHEGRTIYFCCGGCRQRFLAAPEKYQATVHP